MARLIPNENTWVGFATALTLAAPKKGEIAAAVDLTPFLISLNAATTGNALPTPAFDALFETSVPGTVTAQFTADFYRDDATGGDDAWDTLPRATKGYFIISRFGGTGAGNLPETGDEIEVWPVTVTSRSMHNAASNQVLAFTVTCSVPVEPVEAIDVVANTP